MEKEFKVRDRVRIVNTLGGANAGIMSVIISTHENPFGETPKRIRIYRVIKELLSSSYGVIV